MYAVILKHKKPCKNTWMHWLVMLTYLVVQYISIDNIYSSVIGFCIQLKYIILSVLEATPTSMFWDENGAFATKCDGMFQSKFHPVGTLKPMESGLNSCCSCVCVKIFRSVYRDTGLSAYRYVSRHQSTGTPRCTGESRHPYCASPTRAIWHLL